MSTDPGRELESGSSAAPELKTVEADKFEEIHVDVLRRMIVVMRGKHAHVVAANRRFEEETGMENRLGMNNLTDALSHIGTLIIEAPSLTRDQQVAQVAFFEDHLRRSMMESWEQLLDFRLGEIDELWEKKYQGRPRRLQRAQKLTGILTVQEIDKLRIKYKHKLQAGREAKRAGDWEGWERGTNLLIEACVAASELRTAIEETIAAARSLRRDVGIGLIGAAIGAVVAVSLFVGNQLLDHDRRDKNPPAQQQK